MQSHPTEGNPENSQQKAPAKIDGTGSYPYSHNHGSVENGCISNISFLSFRVIFHWTMIMRERVEDLEDKPFLLGPVVTFHGWSALELRGGGKLFMNGMTHVS